PWWSPSQVTAHRLQLGRRGTGLAQDRRDAPKGLAEHRADLVHLSVVERAAPEGVAQQPHQRANLRAQSPRRPAARAVLVAAVPSAAPPWASMTPLAVGAVPLVPRPRGAPGTPAVAPPPQRRPDEEGSREIRQDPSATAPGPRSARTQRSSTKRCRVTLSAHCHPPLCCR